jgi:hypothetical protein
MLQYTVTGTRAAANPTGGCLIVVRETDQSVPGPPILFFEHFGVLLAVNGDAAQLRPYFPVANADEASLAYAIASQAPLP